MSDELKYRLTWSDPVHGVGFSMGSFAQMTTLARSVLAQDPPVHGVMLQNEAVALEEDAVAAEARVPPVPDLRKVAEQDLKTLRQWRNLGMIEDEEYRIRYAAVRSVQLMDKLDRSRK